jgi:hypothetical protein
MPVNSRIGNMPNYLAQACGRKKLNKRCRLRLSFLLDNSLNIPSSTRQQIIAAAVDFSGSRPVSVVRHGQPASEPRAEEPPPIPEKRPFPA